jgi:hypothetical protein
MDFLKNIDGSNVNLTPKGIILGKTYFQVLLVYIQVKGYVTKLECRVTIS